MNGRKKGILTGIVTVVIVAAGAVYAFFKIRKD